MDGWLYEKINNIEAALAYIVQKIEQEETNAQADNQGKQEVHPKAK